MGALSDLNLAPENNLGERVLPEGWTEGWDDENEEIVYEHTDGMTQKGHPGKPDGIIAVVSAIPDMSAMTKLNVSSNALCAEGGGVLAAALIGNHVMKELDISSNYLAEDANDKPDMSGVIAFALAISDMGGLSSLNMARNNIGQLVPPGGWTIAKQCETMGYNSPNGTWQAEAPPDSKSSPEGTLSVTATSLLTLYFACRSSHHQGYVVGQVQERVYRPGRTIVKIEYCHPRQRL
jgi:hypothetical protein